MQRRKRQKPPSYRHRTGYDQAIVTLTDSVSATTGESTRRSLRVGMMPERTFSSRAKGAIQIRLSHRT